MKYFNITTTTTTDLIAKGNANTFEGVVKQITICNVDDQTANNVDLFLEDAAASASTNASNNKYHILKNVDIPVGATILLDSNLNFDASALNLRITTTNAADGGAGKLTVIIK